MLEVAVVTYRDRLAAALAEAGDVSPGLSEFSTRLFAGAAAGDLQHRPVDQLVALTRSAWQFVQQRPAGAAKVRVFNPRRERDGWSSPHTVIEINTEDMPFLVDSLTTRLAALGHELRLLLHPVIRLSRNEHGSLDANGAARAESFIHAEIAQLPDAALGELAAHLQEVFEQVRRAVTDWKPMMALLYETVADLRQNPPALPAAMMDEVFAFLRWLGDDHFTFLGYREFRWNGDRLERVDGSALGMLRDPGLYVLRDATGSQTMTDEIREFLRQPDPLIITKSNLRSWIHRDTQMDYIGIKQFDADGNLVGERRFVGLFTSSAYSCHPRDIPLIRDKVTRVIEQAGFNPTGHDGKALLHILENFPRDELFQIDDVGLLTTALGVLRLEERPRTSVFFRTDRFERFVSALVFVPRDRFETAVREKIEALLEASFNGQITTRYSFLGEDALARWHFIVAITPGHMIRPDLEQLSDLITDVARNWDDRLKEALVDSQGEDVGLSVFRRYRGAFSAAYREQFSAQIGVEDIGILESLSDKNPFAAHLYRLIGDSDFVIRLKTFHHNRPMPLSDVLPVIEHMGLRVISEQTYMVRQRDDERQASVHDFYTVEPMGRSLDLAAVKPLLEDMARELFFGRIEDDGFNRLSVAGGLDFQQIAILRAIAKYLRQVGVSYSQDYIETALRNNAPIASQLVALFMARHDPAQNGDGAAIATAIGKALDQVTSLDEDRILRHYLNVIQCILRTNFFQPAEQNRKSSPTLAFKLDSQAVLGLPLPRPMVEIFVYSPRVEGIHLRGGKVARGGLRWSDRREDFRTEILGLMKAQQVKNSVIVPVGAKGGFVPKRQRPGGDRKAIQDEGIACYKLFVGSLLDLTDNIVNGEIVHPANTRRWDDDDPYLVVAADKGTATFSDIANGISADYGHWLGDAFASGGSAGYDHKAMGITARGAWISVQRHFREMGIDVQTQPVTAVGVGDMSGDVFGNGMLLSRCLKLVAAFDHRHIFLDPDPNPEKAFEERQRLFALPTSSWNDYNHARISEGGGVYPRTLKSIVLTPQVKAVLGIDADSLSPADLMSAILKAPVDLLWFGGIGTYVKASAESNADAGDKANDPVRVNGAELRVKVIGEGANLGMTQRGRIEFAQMGNSGAGGRLNTDAIDNSAGVDCSDHEVNIKILLNAAMAGGKLTLPERDALLVRMTDDVAALVLADNTNQTQALSLAEARAPQMAETHAAFLRALERMGKLDRDVERLPRAAELRDRQARGQGLTRPELAVLLAYAKLTLKETLAATDLPDDPYFEPDLFRSLPRVLGETYPDELRGHRLRREIILTHVVSDMVDTAGPTFVFTLAEETGASPADITRAFILVRDLFGIVALADRLDGWDAQAQIPAMLDVMVFVRQAALWLLTQGPKPLALAAVRDQFAGPIAQLWPADRDLAAQVAALPSLHRLLDIVSLARQLGKPLDEVRAAWDGVDDAAGFTRLRDELDRIVPASQWEGLALRALAEDIDDQQRALVATVANAGGLPTYLAGRADVPSAIAALLEEFTQGEPGLAKLSVAVRRLKAVLR